MIATLFSRDFLSLMQKEKYLKPLQVSLWQPVRPAVGRAAGGLTQPSRLGGRLPGLLLLSIL